MGIRRRKQKQKQKNHIVVISTRYTVCLYVRRPKPLCYHVCLDVCCLSYLPRMTISMTVRIFQASKQASDYDISTVCTPSNI